MWRCRPSQETGLYTLYWHWSLRGQANYLKVQTPQPSLIKFFSQENKLRWFCLLFTNKERISIPENSPDAFRVCLAFSSSFRAFTSLLYLLIQLFLTFFRPVYVITSWRSLIFFNYYFLWFTFPQNIWAWFVHLLTDGSASVLHSSGVFISNYIVTM
jgi:hypothetical protein